MALNTKEELKEVHCVPFIIAAFASFLKKAQKKSIVEKRDSKTQENWHVKDERLYTREKEQTRL